MNTGLLPCIRAAARTHPEGAADEIRDRVHRDPFADDGNRLLGELDSSGVLLGSVIHGISVLPQDAGVTGPLDSEKCYSAARLSHPAPS